MAGIKISDLPAAPSSLLTDVFPADQGLTTYKETLQQVFTLFQTNGEALSRVNDTNVTLTLGGSPLTSLLNATSLTLGWSGTLAETRGGTAQSTYTLGDTLYASAANTLSKLAGNITTAKEYLSQTGTGAVSAAPVWASIAGADIIGAALSKADDTNVTLTLSGSPTTSLLRATTITAGWAGQLAVGRGGTGNSTFTAFSVICAGTTATGAFQNVSGLGSLNQVLISQGAGALPIWGAVPGLTPAALTKTDDTNVTLALGGTPATALLQATSLTLGWTGQLGLTRGGTAASLTASNGGLVYSTASALAILAAGSSGQIPRSGGAGAPTWSTATYPATAGTNGNVLTSDGTNFISSSVGTGIAVTASAVQVFAASGTYTPNAKMVFCTIECLGGGGAGGGAASTINRIIAGGGGGSGSYSRKTTTIAVIGASQTVTIGAAGTAGTAGANPGGNGGDTSVGTICVGKGGTGGAGGADSASGNTYLGGAGGVAGTGDFTATGHHGAAGSNTAAGVFAFGGDGGNSIYGGGAQPISFTASPSAGNAGSLYGAGGSSAMAFNNNLSGGAGSAGLVIITEYLKA